MTTGRLVLVVGPSGVGKDSLIDYARERLAGEPAVQFVKRTVTRAAGSGGEDHDELSPEAFNRAEQAGAFAVTWPAHGLRYGLPAGARAHVEAGGIAVANGSRKAIEAIVGAFPAVLVVNVTAHAEIIQSRLSGRGRENAGEVAARLARASEPLVSSAPVVAIDNSGPIAEGGERLLALLTELRRSDAAPVATASR